MKAAPACELWSAGELCAVKGCGPAGLRSQCVLAGLQESNCEVFLGKAGVSIMMQACSNKFKLQLILSNLSCIYY